MPNIDTGFWINTATAADRTTAAMARRALGALLVQDIGTTYTNPRAGVLPNNGASLEPSSASTSALIFNVKRGYALTVRSAAPQLGAYLCGTSSDVTVTLAAANASNPRIDAIYICQPDPEAGDATHARIDVVTGTPAASPAAPADSALPAGSLRIANVTVPAGATAASACTLADVRVFTGLNNALPVYVDQNALPASAPSGARAIVRTLTYLYNTATNVTMRYGTSGWKPWESDWDAYTPTMSGLTGSGGGANPGWAVSARFRFVSGKVRVEAAVAFINNSSNAAIGMQLPAPFDQSSGVAGSFALFSTGGGLARNASDSNRSYPLVLTGVNNNYVQLNALDANAKSISAVGNTNPFGEVFANNDSISLNFEYSYS